MFMISFLYAVRVIAYFNSRHAGDHGNGSSLLSPMRELLSFMFNSALPQVTRAPQSLLFHSQAFYKTHRLGNGVNANSEGVFYTRNRRFFSTTKKKLPTSA